MSAQKMVIPLRRPSGIHAILIPAFYCTRFWAAELMVGRLISPCRCRGTMKFVHLQCLNSWRYASPNRRSVYQCDQCGYKYHFNRTQYTAIASSIYTRVGSIFPSQFMSLKHPLPWPAPTSQSDSPSPFISYIPFPFPGSFVPQSFEFIDLH